MLLPFKCFTAIPDGSSTEAGSIIIQNNNFRYDIILFTLIIGLGVLMLFSIVVMSLSYGTYKSIRRKPSVADVQSTKSSSSKYIVTHSDNMEFNGNTEADTISGGSSGIASMESDNSTMGENFTQKNVKV